MMYNKSNSREDARSSVAAYESLLDLFTLISFILILAAITYVAQAVGRDQNWSSLIAQVAERGSGAPRTLPQDVLLLIIYRQNSADKLMVMDGSTGSETNLDVKVDGVDAIMSDLSATFARVNTINIAVYEPKEPVNPGIVLSIEKWLAKSGKGQNNIRIRFAGGQ